MPEAEKPHQGIGENRNSEIDAREIKLQRGHLTNEAKMELDRLDQMEALLDEEEKLISELLAMQGEEPSSESHEEDPTEHENIAPQPEDNKQEKAGFLKRTMEKVAKSKGFRVLLATVMAVAINPKKIESAEMPSYTGNPAAFTETFKPFSNRSQLPEELRSDPNLVMQDEENAQPDSESEIGIKNGYGEKGMWLSVNKPGRYAFANAAEVAEVCNNDEKEMIKYTARNQVESFADYLANLPEELQPEGFKGLGIIDTEHKLEGLSKQDYQNVLEQFENDIINKALIRDAAANGEYDNAYMALKNADGSATHDNMDIIKCTTTEHNLKVKELYWQDDNGNEIGSMLVKMTPVYGDDGKVVSFEGCLQVITARGVKIAVYKNIPVVPANIVNTPIKTTEEETIKEVKINEEDDKQPPTKRENIKIKINEEDDKQPPEEDDEQPPESPPHYIRGHRRDNKQDDQFGKEGDAHGGSNVTQSDLVDPSSEITEEENDQTNKGNQGYVDDGKATPGSSSESDGVDENTGFAESGIIADGATTQEGRLDGESDQGADTNGESQMAGKNAYQDDTIIEDGKKKDDSGNSAQEAAREAINNNRINDLGGTDVGANVDDTISPAGGDNYSDAAEKEAVDEGDF